MGRIVVVNFVSLDGVIQSPLFADEDREGGFDQGGWVSAHPDETVGETMAAATVGADGMLLGRKTYEAFTKTWPTASEDEPAVAAMNRMPKYVASRTLHDPTWAGTVVLGAGSDLPAEVARVRAATAGYLVVFGSAGLLPTLIAHDLVDEYRLLVYPVILGSGKRLFSDGSVPSRLRLRDSKATSQGVVISTYER